MGGRIKKILDKVGAPLAYALWFLPYIVLACLIPFLTLPQLLLAWILTFIGSLLLVILILLVVCRRRL